MKFISDITVDLLEHSGNDASVAHAARVSTKGEDFDAIEDKDGGFGLISYLIKHRHGTPFEHNMMRFYVHAPIFVWREWHRHRIGFSYNEESGRYSQLKPVFYIPPAHRPMFKVEGWKPGRPKFLQIDGKEDNDKYIRLINNLKEVAELGYKKYEENLAMGFDPGLARDCLPVNIYSSCWVTCNARSLMAFLSLRTCNLTATFVSYPLYEIEAAALQVESHFASKFPLTHRAFHENGRVAP